MATAAMMVVATVLLVVVTAAHGKVYKVGDSSGWTTIGNPDYKRWAATKTFRVGDVIKFEYNPQFHNVMQVKHEDYKACNASTPLATHSTGNDSITITRHGHHFFLCGVPGHCASGQKVDINVRRLTTGIAPSPSFLSTPGMPTPAAAAGPIAASSADALLKPLNGILLVIAATVGVFLS